MMHSTAVCPFDLYAWHIISLLAWLLRLCPWKPLLKFDVHIMFFLWEDGIIHDECESTVVSDEVLVILAINLLGEFILPWLAKFLVEYWYFHDIAIDALILLFLGLQFTGRMSFGHGGNYPPACLCISLVKFQHNLVRQQLTTLHIE